MDAIDLRLIDLLRDNARSSYAELARQVGLSAPAVLERIHKLEEAGVICAYTALLDARRLGLDVTAFIGVSTERASDVRHIESAVVAMDEVLECHHVTGAHTLMLKVKTRNTETLEELIDAVRSLEGVGRTETMVVLSTNVERTRIPLPVREEAPPRRKAKNERRPRRAGAAE